MLTPAADHENAAKPATDPNAMLTDLAERRPALAETDAMPIPSVDLESAAPRATAQDSC